MGFQDREYYRSSTSDRWSFGAGRYCKALVVFNIGVFLIQLITSDTRVPGAPRPGPFTEWLLMDPDKVFFQGQFWRLLTASFLHDTHSPWHLIFNMLALWYFGQDVEELYGSKEFLAFYLTAAVASNLFWGATASFAHPQALPPGVPEEFAEQLTRPSQALGASGAVFAVAVLGACHYPFRTIYLFFVLPVPLWLVVSIYLLSDFVTFWNRQAFGVAVGAHLAGAAFGFIYFKANFRLLNAWDSFARLFKARPRRSAAPLRLYRPPAVEELAGERPPPNPVDEQLEAKVDEVLAKLSKLGRDQLTDEEKQILARASEVFRRRRS